MSSFSLVLEGKCPKPKESPNWHRTNPTNIFSISSTSNKRSSRTDFENWPKPKLVTFGKGYVQGENMRSSFFDFDTLWKNWKFCSIMYYAFLDDFWGFQFIIYLVTLFVMMLTKSKRHFITKRWREQLLNHGRITYKSWTLSYCQKYFKLLGSQKPCSMPSGLSFFEGFDRQWSTMVDFPTWTHS